eukprot:Phypoly_transcript_08062.p1 GENE.Phypoly_transcript_08062~~Phypoly_transcript_08062.p1  ORF type:complete len:438 (+),score=69.05 Phypoly_transcript_08062:114-1427(+)
MARTIITTKTAFILLVLFVLAMFFYNVVHFSTTLLATKYEEKLRQQQAEIVRYKEQIMELKNDPPPCIAPDSDSESESESESENPTDPPSRPNPPPSTTSIATTVTPPSSSPNPVIPVLVMACNREDYLKTTLAHLFNIRPSAEDFPIIVSQGCGHADVANMLRENYGDTVVALQHHRKQGILPYFAIAQHYGWALKQIFSVMNFEAVIIVEDDLQISVDFFNYFIALYPILRADPSLYCISSWNDNGMDDVVNDPKAVHRTEVFPGLGWMMTKSLWNEIGNLWPEKYWDEFMREPRIRKDRSCLFPEISRNRNIGQRGTSERQFWDKISRIKFNEEYVNFTGMDMSYLMKDRYDADLKSRIEKAKTVAWTEVTKYENEDLRITYENFENFKSLAKFFRLMEDDKEGMPRTSYKGIVIFKSKGNTVFVTPENLPYRW